MKILFVVATFNVGGAERHTLDLVHSLSQRHNSCVFASVKSRKEAALDLQSLDEGAIFSCEAKRFLDLQALRSLICEIEKYSPDVVVAVNQYALMYLHLAKTFSNSTFRIAVVFHSTKLVSQKDEFLHWFYQHLFKRSDLLVFVCDFQANYWKARGLSAMCVETVHNGVDTERFSPDTTNARQKVRSDFGIAQSDFVIGITAAFRPEKNHAFLLRALAQLRLSGIPAKLLLVGDGPLRTALEVEASSLGVYEDVAFAGVQSDVRPFIAAFDVFALVSFTEAFSLAALEAMAMGIPAVLSDVGGAREMVVDGETGFVFQTDDVEQFIAAMNALRENDTAKVMGMAAHRFVNAHFTHKSMVDRYEQLFGALVPQGMRDRR
jgi:glycosyltransferase involved in cell wall biosynthesis